MQHWIFIISRYKCKSTEIPNCWKNTMNNTYFTRNLFSYYFKKYFLKVNTCTSNKSNKPKPTCKDSLPNTLINHHNYFKLPSPPLNQKKINWTSLATPSSIFLETFWRKEKEKGKPRKNNSFLCLLLLLLGSTPTTNLQISSFDSCTYNCWEQKTEKGKEKKRETIENFENGEARENERVSRK